MNGQIIVIEGIDTTGKTTLALGLADKLSNAVYHKSPGSRTQAERSKFDMPGISTEERFKFYLNANKEDLQKILALTGSGKTVVCDRFITSTIVGHKSMNYSLDCTEAEAINSATKKVQILLVASIETILQRLSGRNEITRFEKDTGFLTSMQEGFLNRTHDLMISTDTHDITQTLNSVHSFISR